MSDEHEEQQAEALRRALEDEATGGDPPVADEIETARLLEYAASGGALDADALERGKSALLKDFDQHVAAEPERKPGRRWVWTLAGATGALAIAAVVSIGQLQMKASPPPAPQTPALAMPTPSAKLLEAQAATVTKPDENIEALEEEMRPFRRQLLRALRNQAARADAWRGASDGRRWASR